SIGGRLWTRRWVDSPRTRHFGLRTSMVEIRGCKRGSHQRVVRNVGPELLPGAQCFGGPARGVSCRPHAGEKTPTAAGHPAESAGGPATGLRAHLSFLPAHRASVWVLAHLSIQ